jgi:hypothetical protein
MKSFMKVAVLSLASMSTIAMAKHHENCVVVGKKIHVKDKAACDKKKGVFMDVKAPEVKAPEVKAPEVKVPEVKAPEVPKL